MVQKFRSLILIFVIFSLLFGCGRKENDPEIEDFSAQEIFQSASGNLEDNRFRLAARKFEEIERLYPYSDYARQGTLQAAYAYNLAREYDLSRDAAERFLSFYPGDQDAGYAQYLIAMSYYHQLDLKGRDRAIAKSTLDALFAVVQDYGDSQYAQSANFQIDIVVDRLAIKEMEVGRYYLSKQHYGAAIKRFSKVVDNTFLDDFQILDEEEEISLVAEPPPKFSEMYSKTTSHVPEALHRLVEAYVSIGLISEAEESAAILAHNFNNSEWYSDTYTLLQNVGANVPPEKPRDGFFRRFNRMTLRGEWL